jgi:hypothetical protein
VAEAFVLVVVGSIYLTPNQSGFFSCMPRGIGRNEIFVPSSAVLPNGLSSGLLKLSSFWKMSYLFILFYFIFLVFTAI